jgi:hypothetical protein
MSAHKCVPRHPSHWTLARMAKALSFHKNIVLPCYKTRYLNEEVNCTEPSPSDSVPFLNIPVSIFSRLIIEDLTENFFSIAFSEQVLISQWLETNPSYICFITTSWYYANSFCGC